MSKKINDIMNYAWGEVQNNPDWVAEKLIKEGLNILNLNESIFDKKEPIENILLKFPYESISGNTRKKTKQNLSNNLIENLSDVNKFLGTNYYSTKKEIDNFTNIGFLESWYYDIKNIKNIKNNIKSLLVGTSIGLICDFANDLINYELYNIPFNGSLIGNLNPSLLVYSLVAILGISYDSTCQKSNYKYNKSKKISYYQNRKELLNPQKIHICVPIHEYCHMIFDKTKSQLMGSMVANEGIATKSLDLLKGKYGPVADLDISIIEYNMLDLTLNLIDPVGREHIITEELESSIYEPFPYLDSKKRQQNEIYAKGFSSISYLVDTRGESIIPELVSL